MRELLKHVTGKIEEEFWDRVDKTSTPNGCWPWRPGGQDLFVITGVGTVTAARVAYVIDRGSEPPSAEPFIIRTPSCSHPHCVRPSHLRSSPARNGSVSESPPEKLRAYLKKQHDALVDGCSATLLPISVRAVFATEADLVKSFITWMDEAGL